MVADCSSANAMFEAKNSGDEHAFGATSRIIHVRGCAQQLTPRECPRATSSALGGTFPKAMYATWLVLASLVRCLPQQHAFLGGLDVLIAEQNNYKLGVKQLLPQKWHSLPIRRRLSSGNFACAAGKRLIDCFRWFWL